ncbi:MAG: 3-hydroxyacyl-CoA dehydrogenase family protein, partial [Gaiellaceae bacterium]
PNVAEANGSADLVLESIVEELEAKEQVLRAAARTFPGALLASNTSSLSITALGEASGAAERMLGIHYLSPPLLTRPVEVVVGARTARQAVERACAILHGLGKLPVVVERGVPGFVWNRLQFALLREALWLVGEGVASPETVDAVVKEGLARRWRYTGPFETLALGGVATFTAIAANLFPELSTAQTVDDHALLAAKDEAMLAELRNRRDRGLAEELRRSRAGEPGA